MVQVVVLSWHLLDVGAQAITCAGTTQLAEKLAYGVYFNGCWCAVKPPM
jgi:hypothetical protein